MITFGKKKQVNCSETDYYKFLGYVANHPNDINIVWEHNEQQGAWGSEGRIQFYSNTIQMHFPKGFGFTEGVGSICCRLNCNDLIQNMLNLGFAIGSNQNVPEIRNNVPSQYQSDFDAGCGL